MTNNAFVVSVNPPDTECVREAGKRLVKKMREEDFRADIEVISMLGQFLRQIGALDEEFKKE